MNTLAWRWNGPRTHFSQCSPTVKQYMTAYTPKHIHLKYTARRSFVCVCVCVVYSTQTWVCIYTVEPSPRSRLTQTTTSEGRLCLSPFSISVPHSFLLFGLLAWTGLACSCTSHKGKHTFFVTSVAHCHAYQIHQYCCKCRNSFFYCFILLYGNIKINLAILPLIDNWVPSNLGLWVPALCEDPSIDVVC